MKLKSLSKKIFYIECFELQISMKIIMFKRINFVGIKTISTPRLSEVDRFFAMPQKSCGHAIWLKNTNGQKRIKSSYNGNRGIVPTKFKSFL